MTAHWTSQGCYAETLSHQNDRLVSTLLIFISFRKHQRLGLTCSVCFLVRRSILVERMFRGMLLLHTLVFPFIENIRKTKTRSKIKWTRILELWPSVSTVQVDVIAHPFLTRCSYLLYVMNIQDRPINTLVMATWPKRERWGQLWQIQEDVSQPKDLNLWLFGANHFTQDFLGNIFFPLWVYMT